MEGDIHDLRRFRDKIAAAYAEAMRLGDSRVASIMMRSMVGIDLTIEQLKRDHARTRPQIEALKRLIGAT